MSKLCEHNSCDVVIQGRWDDCELCEALKTIEKLNDKFKELQEEFDQLQEELAEKEVMIENLSSMVMASRSQINWIREGF